MQYEQKLLHPFIMESHAFTLPSRSRGRPSATDSALSASNTRPLAPERPWTCSVLSNSSGKRQSSCGPKQRSTMRYDFFTCSRISALCAIQPQRMTMRSGWTRFKCVSAPTLPNTRIVACSRTAQVFTAMTSALSSSSVIV